MAAASAPFLIRASKEVNKSLRKSTIPLVGVFGAFSFLVMMFNVPLPGGTTGHAVGSVLASIVLGPWLSTIAVSIALVIQALFFGDGGVLALGANIFNMAIVMSFVGYGIFHALRRLFKNMNQSVVAAIAGYVAINVAALCAAVEVGLQPLLFKTASGHALYFPYPLTVSIPAMLLGHLTVAGFAELVITGFGLSWISRQFPSMVKEKSLSTEQKSMKPLVVLFACIVVLVPLGLLAPGTAWGEWGREELAHMGLGYIPSGFDRLSSVWSAPFGGYDVPIFHNAWIGYLLSAVVGVICILSVFWVLSFVSRRTSADHGNHQ